MCTYFKDKAVLLVFVLSIITGCSPATRVTGPGDFDHLTEIKKFEYEYSLHEGIKYRLLGDYSRAYYFLNRCIEIFPYSDVANYEISNIYILAGEYEEAVTYALSAVEIDPGNIWYYQHLAQLYRELNEIDNAIAVYSKAIRLFDEPGIMFALAALLSFNENYDDAIEIYNDLENIIGIDERISISRQHIYMQQGQFERAYHEVRTLTELFPDEPRYLGILAELYAALDMTEEALITYHKLFQIDPENGMAQLSVAEFLINQGKFDDAYNYLISAFRNLNIDFSDKAGIMAAIGGDQLLVYDYKSEIETLGLLLIDQYPELELPRAIMTEFYINLENYSEAGKLLEDLFRSNRKNLNYAEQLLAVKGYSENYADVIKYGEEIIKIFPETVIGHYFLGLAYYVEEIYDKSVDIFNSTLELDNLDDDIKGTIYSFLGDLYNKKEEFSLSDCYFERAIELDGSNFVVLNNYAYYLALRRENLDKALQYSQIAIDNSPNNSSFLDTYAWILYKLEKYDDALVYIKLSYENSGSDSYEIVKHYGQILGKLGRYSEALEFFKLARALTDNDEEIDILIRDYGRYLEE